MRSSSVAILQNQFKVNGRSRVVCEFIDVLNEMGIEPDLLTFTPEEIGRDTGPFLGFPDLRFGYRRVAPIPAMRGYFWQVLAINQLTRRHHASYDLVINSNDTLYGLNRRARYLHYIHYPTPGKTPYRYRTNPLRLWYGRLMGWLIRMSGKPRLDDDIYANSRYTRQAILDLHSISPEQVKVVYPPTIDEAQIIRRETSPEGRARCVSLGAFMPEKRQLEQIEIARRLPDLDFWIIGTVTSEGYYQACKAAVEQSGVDNIRLCPNLPYEELQQALHQSRYFLHTMRHEPFGISTVQAIAAGCIPVVSDTAGQQEIVPRPELRFNDVEEAVSIFQELTHQAPAEQQSLHTALQAHIQQFSRECFREHAQQIISRKLQEVADDR